MAQLGRKAQTSKALLMRTQAVSWCRLSADRYVPYS